MIEVGAPDRSQGQDLTAMGTRSFVSTVNSNTDLNCAGYPGILDAAAADGSTTTVTLAAGSSSVDYAYNSSYIKMTSGNASGETRRIVQYIGTTRIATVTPAFTSAVAATDTYRIYGVVGVSQGGAANTITLDSSALAVTNYYTGAYIRINSGEGTTQTRYISSYDTATKKATVSEDWDIIPTDGTIYSTFGEGGTVTDGASSTSLSLSSSASGTNDFYNTMAVEILACSGSSDAVGQIRTITDYVGDEKRATVSPAWTTTPSGTIQYRVFPGWGGEIEEVVDYNTQTSHITTAPYDFGVLEYLMSMTDTSLNASGNSVAVRNISLWGKQIGNGEKGKGMHGRSITTRYMRTSLVVMTDQLVGGIQTKYSFYQEPIVTQTIEEQIGLRTESSLTKTVVAAKVEGSGIYRNLQTNTQGELAVAIPTTAFGDVRVSELTPQIQMNFVSEVGSQELVTFTGGAQSTIRHEDAQYYLRIGDSPLSSGDDAPTVATGDYAVMRTKKVGRYRAGLGGLCRFTAVFSEPNNYLWQFAGLATPGNALEFGYSSTGSPAASPVEFGVNRASVGRLEVRVLSIKTAPTADGNITLTLPNFPTAANAVSGGSSRPSSIVADTQDYVIEILDADTAAEVARKIAETPDWATYQWDAQNIGTSVVFRGVGVGARANETYTFVDTDTTGLELESFQPVQAGIKDALPEIREISIATAATSDGTISFSLDGGANIEIELTSAVHDTVKKVAWAIVNKGNWSSQNWTAEIINLQGFRIRFTSTTNAARTNAYSFTAGGTGVTIDTFIQRKIGTPKIDNWVFQKDWNIDKCDGTGPSQFFLNPQSGNVYAISFQYLGFGGITFLVEDRETAKFIPVHTIKYAGTSSVTHLENPHMPLQASIYSIFGGLIPQQTHTMSIASWAYFTEGRIQHIAPRFSASNYQASVLSSGERTERAILLLKHPEIFNDGPSQIGVFIKKITAGLDASGGNITEIRVRLNPVLTTRQPNWRPVGYPDTPVLVATGTTTGNGGNNDIQDMEVGGGTRILTQGTAGDGPFELKFDEFELNRGDVLCVSVFAYAGSPDASASIDWVEDH